MQSWMNVMADEDEKFAAVETTSLTTAPSPRYTNPADIYLQDLEGQGNVGYVNTYYPHQGPVESPYAPQPPPAFVPQQQPQAQQIGRAQTAKTLQSQRTRPPTYGTLPVHNKPTKSKKKAAAGKGCCSCCVITIIIVVIVVLLGAAGAGVAVFLLLGSSNEETDENGNTETTTPGGSSTDTTTPNNSSGSTTSTTPYPGGLFTDASFDQETSLGRSEFGPNEFVPQVNRWERAIEAFPTAQIFAANTNGNSEKIRPNDINQGQVGDCWLLAAMAAVADQNPDFIKNKIFDRVPGIDVDGRYQINLWNWDSEAWEYTIIDNFLGFTGGNNLTYAGPPNGATLVDLWVPLLEKAVAKFFGSYGALNGGYSNVAFFKLTGCKEQQYWIQDSNGTTWSKRQVAMPQGTSAPGTIGLYGGSESFDGDAFFDNVLVPYGAKYPATAEIHNQKPGVAQVLYDQYDLQKGHAYTFIQAATINGQKVVELRNPWGGFTSEAEDYAVNFTDADFANAGLEKPQDGDARFWLPFNIYNQFFVVTTISACEL